MKKTDHQARPGQNQNGEARQGTSSPGRVAIIISGILYLGVFCGRCLGHIIIRTSSLPGSMWFIAFNKDETEILAQDSKIGRVKDKLKKL